MGAYVVLLSNLSPEDAQVLDIFSHMFIFSALMVAGATALFTRQKGLRRALVSLLAFFLSYAVFRIILYYGITPHF
jgi:hypothetical protein